MMDGNTSACDEMAVITFNGDDFFAPIVGTNYSTATSSDIVDQIGLFSTTDPGSAWPVCGSTSGRSTSGMLLLRREHHLLRRMERRDAIPVLFQRQVRVDGAESVHDADTWTCRDDAHDSGVRHACAALRRTDVHAYYGPFANANLDADPHSDTHAHGRCDGRTRWNFLCRF